MEMTAKQVDAQQSIKTLIAKCWENTSFKDELVASPVKTLEKYSGQKLNLPTGKELVVVDQMDPTKLYINIPSKPTIDDLELTDEQLELVSGGEFIIGAACLGVAAGIAVGVIIAHL
jgi:hypothetical protein